MIGDGQLRDNYAIAPTAKAYLPRPNRFTALKSSFEHIDDDNIKPWLSIFPKMIFWGLSFILAEGRDFASEKNVGAAYREARWI